MTKSKKYLVAVYGSLRKGLHNYKNLEFDTKAKLLGEFQTEPVYTLYDTGASFPGLKEDGSTSITMEVYEVDEKLNKTVEQLEGYEEGSEDFNHYNKVEIETPFGLASTYIYNYSIEGMAEVEGGDWTDYIKTQTKYAY